MPFQENDESIIKPAMQQPWPETNRISREFKFLVNAPQELTEDNMHGDHVGIEAVDAGTERAIVPQTPEMKVPAPPEMVGGKPPEIIEDVRSRQLRDAMPGDCCQINIFDSLAIDVYFKLVGDLRDPLDYDALRAVALIEERGDNCQARFRG